MPVSGDAFKGVMRRFATGVTVVTTRDTNVIHGFTVNAFASVTAEPATVLVCVNRSGRAHAMISRSGAFCVNILALEQQPIAVQFQDGEPHERFKNIVHRSGPSGSPIIDDVLAYVDCQVEEELTAGTHTVFLGRVLEAGERSGAPLGYYDRAYRDFSVVPSP
jgi:flavin reductase (DIM6/NTAB) family NADH-FMN oxidoreductase RutF